MSYLYDIMKDALGGKNFVSGTVSKSWSPNEVRAIVLMRDYLLVADYLKNPKVYPFNYEELARDLGNPNRRGSLNNLLESRQLSCLEEIYVDEAFCQKFQNVINLEGYVRGLVNTKSRLRYFGYVSGMPLDAVSRFYQEAFQGGKFDRTLAKDMGGFNYSDTNNEEWYKRHNLREQFYELDKPKGRLSIYFAKCEGEIVQHQDRLKALDEAGKLMKMYIIDFELADRLQILMKYAKFLETLDTPMYKKLGQHLSKELLSTDLPVLRGVTMERFKKSFIDLGMMRNENSQAIVKLYGQLGVFDSKEGVKPTYTQEGILKLGTRISNALSAVLKSTSKQEDILWRMSLMSLKQLSFHECEFKSLVETKLNLQVTTLDVSKYTIEKLMDIVYAVGGVSEEAFKSKIKGGSN